MPYVPVTGEDRKIMLRTIGASSLEELFTDIPEQYRFPALAMEEGLSETETLREISALASANTAAGKYSWFLGAGCYDHFIPAVVGALASRGEFLTAYTPYQAEVSQGTLEAIFEYQSMIASLFGMEVVNAGHYDGATALAEAAIIALKQGGRRILLPQGLHPEYREVLDTYLAAYNPVMETYTGSPAQAVRSANAAGAVSPNDSGSKGGHGNGGEKLACVIAAYPDFFGTIPDLRGAAEAAHGAGGLFIVHTDPLIPAILKSPGEYGADIVTAEGQSLGNDMNYGGPFLGIMAASKDLMRKIPGRIVGEAKDAQGRRGFALTLSAREQHIRRERAVSNICSNQGLSMLRSCIYLALMGKTGLREAAELCWHRSHYAASCIASLRGFSVTAESGTAAGSNFFKEFTVRLPGGKMAEEVSEPLIKKGIVPGLPLSRYFPERKNELLLCVTEKNSKADIDRLVQELEGVCL